MTADDSTSGADSAARTWSDAESDAAFEKLGDRLIDATRRFMRSHRRERIQSALYTVEGHELGRAQIDTLEVIANEGDVRMNQLAARLRLDPSTVTRTTNPLVELGLVERFTDPENRRYVVLRLTPRGTKTITRIGRQRRQVMRAALTPMAPDRRLLLVELLDEYTTLMEDFEAAREGDVGD